MLTLLFL